MRFKRSRMDRVSIELPDEELAWARSRVEAGDAESLDAYFRDLTARDRIEAAEIDAIDAALREGEESGLDPRAAAAVFAEKRSRYQP